MSSPTSSTRPRMSPAPYPVRPTAPAQEVLDVVAIDWKSPVEAELAAHGSKPSQTSESRPAHGRPNWPESGLGPAPPLWRRSISGRRPCRVRAGHRVQLAPAWAPRLASPFERDVDPPEVTVVIPTRNRWRRLSVALEGALRQEDADLEIVVVDEASSDETPERLADLDDSRVRVFRHEQARGGRRHETGASARRAASGLPSSTTTMCGLRASCARCWMPHRPAELASRTAAPCTSTTG